jgi:hypothetical protein
MQDTISPAQGQIATTPDAAPLCHEIKTLIEKAQHAEAKAQQFYISAGQKIEELKKLFPDNWETLVKEQCGLGRSRAYEILAIADGRATVEEVRSGNKQRQKISCGRRKTESVTSRTEQPPCSPSFDAACRRAKRLGHEVRRIDSSYQLTSPDYCEAAHFTSLGKLNQQLKEIADSQPEVSGNFEDDTFEPDENVEEPGKVLVNVLDSIKQSKAVAEAYRKILKASTFDRGAKKEISEAIESLIKKWRSVQSTLAAHALDEPPTEPSGGGSEPKVGEPTENEPTADHDCPGTVLPPEAVAGAKVEAPPEQFSGQEAAVRDLALTFGYRLRRDADRWCLLRDGMTRHTVGTLDEVVAFLMAEVAPRTPAETALSGTVSVTEEPKAPTIDRSLDIPAFLIRTEVGAPHDAPLPSPSPAPAPATTPPPKPKPAPTLHRNPLDGWRKVKHDADELERRTNLFRDLAGNKRISFTDAEWDEVDEVRKHVAVLRKADRAVERAASAQSANLN